MTCVRECLLSWGVDVSWEVVMSIQLLFVVLLVVSIMAHCQQLGSARRVEDSSYFTDVANDSLKGVLLLQQASTRRVDVILSIFALEVQTSAPQAEIVVAGKYEDIVW